MHFKHILVTTDFSDVSKAAFDLAAYESKMDGTKITLINVAEEFELAPELRRVVWDPSNIEKLKEEYVKKTAEELKELEKEYFHGQEVNSVSLVSHLPAAQVLCDYAKDKNCDLIVMASHGRGFLGSVFLGSTVQKVLAMAQCPVLVVRANGEDAS